MTNNVPIKHWTKDVHFDENAKKQLINLSQLPFIHKHIAVMPDVHLGKGCTIGTVLPTINAIIPASVGVDIGCGMQAVRTNLMAKDLPDSLETMRLSIEIAIPHGKGKWEFDKIPHNTANTWIKLQSGFDIICEKFPILRKTNNINHLGTLGGGNHFVEVCIDENQQVWFMLHSGSRGVGNAIGNLFIELAKKDMRRYFINLPDEDLAYIPKDSPYFKDYIHAVTWAQNFAHYNRNIMMENLIREMSIYLDKSILLDMEVIECHHNYISTEHHFGKNVYITRKGAVSAKKGELGIIPGSMGAKSYIVRGLGNEQSFHSCSHGAGRMMSRTQAKNEVSALNHAQSLENVECRKDESTLDETPSAYKNIDDVMSSQQDLVEIVHTLKQILCVKG